MSLKKIANELNWTIIGKPTYDKDGNIEIMVMAGGSIKTDIVRTFKKIGIADKFNLKSSEIDKIDWGDRHEYKIYRKSKSDEYVHWLSPSVAKMYYKINMSRKKWLNILIAELKKDISKIKNKRSIKLVRDQIRYFEEEKKLILEENKILKKIGTKKLTRQMQISQKTWSNRKSTFKHH